MKKHLIISVVWLNGHRYDNWTVVSTSIKNCGRPWTWKDKWVPASNGHSNFTQGRSGLSFCQTQKAINSENMSGKFTILSIDQSRG